MPPRRPASRSQTVSACSSAPPAPAVALLPGPDGPSPWLRPHYRASQLLRDGPPLPPRLGTLPLAGLPLGVLPLATGQPIVASPLRRGEAQLRTFHVGA